MGVSLYRLSMMLPWLIDADVEFFLLGDKGSRFGRINLPLASVRHLLFLQMLKKHQNSSASDAWSAGMEWWVKIPSWGFSAPKPAVCFSKENV